jgi:hypothetical protein
LSIVIIFIIRDCSNSSTRKKKKKKKKKKKRRRIRKDKAVLVPEGHTMKTNTRILVTFHEFFSEICLMKSDRLHAPTAVSPEKNTSVTLNRNPGRFSSYSCFS